MLKIRICILAVAVRAWALPLLRAAAAAAPPSCFLRLFALRRSPFALRSLALILLAGVLALPVLAVLASWLPVGQGDVQAGSILREMAATVLPGYVLTTLVLAVVAAPVVEEIVFRGFVLKSFLGRMPWVVAVLVQGLLFGAALALNHAFARADQA